jgi:hypothetical protein
MLHWYKTKDYNLPDKEFFVLKPKRKWTECMDDETKDFDASKKYPVLCIITQDQVLSK